MGEEIKIDIQILSDIVRAGSELYRAHRLRLREKGFSSGAINSWPELVDWMEAVTELPGKVLTKTYINSPEQR
ncbi:MAG TPA: hypothetical protein ENI23_08290 [bacterium]|nr:hypothetical protein [bacterium]